MLAPDYFILKNQGWTDKCHERYYGGVKQNHILMVALEDAERFETEAAAKAVAQMFPHTSFLAISVSDAVPITLHK